MQGLWNRAAHVVTEGHAHHDPNTCPASIHQPVCRSERGNRGGPVAAVDEITPAAEAGAAQTVACRE